jgi:hypothetical protein
VPQTFVVSLNKAQEQEKKVSQELETQEKIIAELRKLRAETENLKTQVKVNEDTLNIYKNIDEARTLQISALKSALEDVKKYDMLSQKKEELFKQEISLLNAEIERLRGQVQSEKRSKFLSKVGSALLTIGVVFAATR